jgi:hypothetical protein
MGLRGEHMTIVVGFDAATQIVRRTDVDVVAAQHEKIDIPHRASLPALLGSFGRHPSPDNSGGLPPEARQGEGWRATRDDDEQYRFAVAL